MIHIEFVKGARMMPCPLASLHLEAERLCHRHQQRFASLTVMLTYELEYRMMPQLGGFHLDLKDPNYDDAKKTVEIFGAHPIST